MGKKFNISEKINKVNVNGKNDDLVVFFKDNISNGNITVQEVVNYAKNKQYFLSDARIINELGVYVSELNENSQRDLWINLCEIAAERNSISANQNCALYYINEFEDKKPDAEKALHYAKKIIELTQRPEEYKLTYSKVLFANDSYEESAKHLMEYFNYKNNLYIKQKEVGKKKEIKNDLENVISFSKTMINFFKDKLINTLTEYENEFLTDCINHYLY
ncbi:MAG: hypothetical protein LEGION0398_MBIBDBAK_00706 [Legionellaceae bacterium]